MIISATDEENGYIESVESKKGNIIGVQWHPENLDKHVKLFKYFLKN